MEDGLRVDILLHRLCLTRSRNEAKTACEAGAVLVQGREVRASQPVSPGQRVEIRFPQRLLEFELTALPGKSVSRKTARELYHILRDERVSPLD